MFNLIIVLLSMALVIGLSAATIYLGGPQLYAAGNTAAAARMSNEAEQISIAMTMYATDHDNTLPTSMDALTTDGVYLDQAPPDWQSITGFFTKSPTELNNEVCLDFNIIRGVPFIPSCSDPVYQAAAMCCQN